MEAILRRQLNSLLGAEGTANFRTNLMGRYVYLNTWCQKADLLQPKDLYGFVQVLYSASLTHLTYADDWIEFVIMSGLVNPKKIPDFNLLPSERRLVLTLAKDFLSHELTDDPDYEERVKMSQDPQIKYDIIRCFFYTLSHVLVDRELYKSAYKGTSRA